MRTRKTKRTPTSDGALLAMSIRQGARCGICGFPLSASSMHVDHIVHISRGGTNATRNKRLVCKPCNLKRGNRL